MHQTNPDHAPRLRGDGGWTKGSIATAPELDQLASTLPPADIEEARTALRRGGPFTLGVSMLGVDSFVPPDANGRE